MHHSINWMQFSKTCLCILMCIVVHVIFSANEPGHILVYFNIAHLALLKVLKSRSQQAVYHITHSAPFIATTRLKALMR